MPERPQGTEGELAKPLQADITGPMSEAEGTAEVDLRERHSRL